MIVISPLTWSSGGGTLLWEGPTLPVLGPLDISTDEIRIAVVNGLRLAASSGWRSAPTPFSSTTTGSSPRRASPGGRRSRSRSPPGSSRASSAMRRGSPSRCGGRGVELHGARGLRDAALAARRRVARAGDGPGRGDGGARVRPAAARHARLAPPGRGSTTLALVGAVALVAVAACGSSDASSGSAFAYPGGAPAIARRLARARGRARSSRCSARPGAASRRCCGRSPGSCRISTAGGSRAASRSPGSTRGRTAPPSSPARVASVFQDPEDQVVMTRVENEVAFGLENVGVAPELIWPRVAVGARRGRGVAPRGAAHGRALGRRAAARLPRLGARARAAAAAARRADVAARPARGRGVPRARSSRLALRRRALRAARRPRARRSRTA